MQSDQPTLALDRIHLEESKDESGSCSLSRSSLSMITEVEELQEQASPLNNQPHTKSTFYTSYKVLLSRNSNVKRIVSDQEVTEAF